MSDAARVDVVTFGCRLNCVESETMRREALAAGHHDLTIVNTCAVTAEAARQGRQAIRRLRRERPGGRIVVTGCAAEVEADRFRAMPEIDAVLPNGRKTEPALWRRAEGPGQSELAGGAGQRAPHQTRGFVEVQNGCDHRCTFCIIPYGRGASRSVRVAEVVARIGLLVASGAREVVLTGVDVTAYGADLDERPSLGRLVEAILQACPELPRLRLSSLDCCEADPVLLRLFAEELRLMPHLHLSLQSGSDLILKRMKRRHLRADAIAFCRDLRARRPDVVFGADFIVGFPTETEAQFAETLDLVEACGISHIHAFPYSARPGTPAARMPSVPGELVRERAVRLRARGDGRLSLHLDRQVGRTLPALFERDGKARAPDFTQIRLGAAPAPAPGSIRDVIIDGHDGRALAGRLP